MRIEISNGELVDRVTILSIKLQRMSDEAKLRNVRAEHEALSACMDALGVSVETPAYRDLFEVNGALWDIENRLRAKESARQFDEEFVQLAREVYFNNDRRARIKRSINDDTASGVIEEKEYHRYS
jgi:hypothetical protein